MDKKNTSSTEKKKTKAATFKFDPDVLWGLQYVSLMDQESQSDIIGKALTEYLEKWEKKHGKLPQPKK